MYSLQLFNTSLSKQNSVIVGGVIGKQCISCSCVQSENVEYSNLRMFLPRVMDFKLLQDKYLQPIITQYFIDNKSEIWLLFLIAHSKR